MDEKRKALYHIECAMNEIGKRKDTYYRDKCIGEIAMAFFLNAISAAEMESLTDKAYDTYNSKFEGR